VLDAPATVGFGRSISVSGARSVDVGGRVVQYRWRLDGGAAVVTADAAFTFVVDPASPLGLGSHAIELAVVDDSGNVSAPAFRTVTVRYVFTGFFAPVRNLPIVNLVNAGRVASVRWRLSDAAGNPVSSLGSFTSLMSGPIACNASPRDVAEKEMAAADGGPLRYDPEAGQFVFSWRTSREWAGCRLLRLTLADGSRTFAMFRLR
jgi:hypothetical protein